MVEFFYNRKEFLIGHQRLQHKLTISVRVAVL